MRAKRLLRPRRSRLRVRLKLERQRPLPKSKLLSSRLQFPDADATGMQTQFYIRNYSLVSVAFSIK